MISACLSDDKEIHKNQQNKSLKEADLLPYTIADKFHTVHHCPKSFVSEIRARTKEILYHCNTAASEKAYEKRLNL